MAKKKEDTVEKLTHLTDTDMRYVEGMHSQESNALRVVEIETLKLQKLNIELKLLSANYTLKNKEAEEQKATLESKQKELLAIRESNKTRLKSFATEKGLEEKWGYNPLTGEIK